MAAQPVVEEDGGLEERVKGVDFTFKAYVYKWYSKVQELLMNGQFVGALAVLCNLIDSMPKKIKDKFKDRIAMYRYTMDMIPVKFLEEKGDEIADAEALENIIFRISQKYARQRVRELLNDLSDVLGNRRYMEETVRQPTSDGYDHDWVQQG